MLVADQRMDWTKWPWRLMDQVFIGAARSIEPPPLTGGRHRGGRASSCSPSLPENVNASFRSCRQRRAVTAAGCSPAIRYRGGMAPHLLDTDREDDVHVA